MCRYAFNNYKQTYACFKCRKAFKKTNLTDYLKQHEMLDIYGSFTRCKTKAAKDALEQRYGTNADKILAEYQEKISVCPECGGKMANLGMDMRVPRQVDEKGWKIIEGMFQIGAIYQTCGCNGLGYIPKNTNDYEAYLNENLAHYKKRLDEVEADPELNSFERNERAEYWAERIEKIKRQIIGLSLA